MDTMSICLSFARARCRHFKVLVLIRRVYAYAFARNLRFSFRWIPSELNSSDRPSRHISHVLGTDDEDPLATLEEHCNFAQAAVPPATESRAAPGAAEAVAGPGRCGASRAGPPAEEAEAGGD